MITWEAHAPTGRIVRTFSARDLAERYASAMKAQGTDMVIKKARIDRRLAS